MSRKYIWHINAGRETILFCLILLLVIFARFLYLDADPPVDISPSTGIETDPPAHLSYARHSVVKDDWNPYDDDRFVLYQYSVVSLFGKTAYEIFGVGLYQTNLSAVLMSIFTLVLFYLIVRKAFGNVAGLAAFLFSGFSFLSVFLMRRPLMENGLNLLLMSGLFALIFFEKRYIGHFLFGLFTVAAVVFGKIIALSFGLVPLVYYLHVYVNENRTVAVKRMLSCGGGGGHYCFLYGIWPCSRVTHLPWRIMWGNRPWGFMGLRPDFNQ